MTLLQDVRYGSRLLIGKPGFSAAAVTALAFGIGASTAMFSLVNAFLLKPVQIRDPQQVVGLYSRGPKDSYRAFSYPNYADLRASNGVFTSLMAHNLTMVGVAEGDTTRRTFADIVSSNYFEALGANLFRGRPFTAEEERPGSRMPVAIVSYSFWKRHGDMDSLRINGQLFTVIGITPEGFTGTTALVSAEIYLPLGMYELLDNDFGTLHRALALRDNHALILVGRLKPGLTQTAADAQLLGVSAQMERAYPAENREQTLIVRPLSRLGVSTNPQTDKGLGVPATLLLSMAGVVLLIASLNVANMMLARGADRRKEIAVRLALGATRGSLLRQLFIEGLLLASAGGAAGLAIATWGTRLLVDSMARLAPLDLVFPSAPDIRVLAATGGFCLFSTLLFGFGPAWKLSKPDLVSDLKDGASNLTGHFRGLFSGRNMLVVSQLSLSLALLTGAGLFVRSAMEAARIEPGFQMDGVLLAEVDAGLAGYDEARGRQLYTTILDRLRSVPGVESAAIAATVPFGMVSLGRSVHKLDSGPGRPEQSCRLNMVEGDYFRTMKIPLIRGRAFRDGEKDVVVIDQLTAARLWPNGAAVGRRIRMNRGEDKRDAEIVGIAGNVQERIFGHDGLEPHVYVPFSQEYQSDVTIHLRTAAMQPAAVRALVREVDPRLPVIELRSFRQHLEAGFDLWLVRTGARLFAVFGIIALLLATVGLYGVRAYHVARRTREIGIRMALGAGTSDTLRLVLREGLLVTAIGLGMGLAISAVLGKVLGSMLYRVAGIDPLVFTIAPVVLALVSLAACYLPARRAARVDPMVALRYE